MEKTFVFGVSVEGDNFTDRTCRNEYDFYTRFATSVLQGTSSRIEHALESAKEFSISLGIKPKDIEPETILSLPEKIARKKRAHIVICIDEFQQQAHAVLHVRRHILPEAHSDR